jgi:hypothetical protein
VPVRVDDGMAETIMKRASGDMAVARHGGPSWAVGTALGSGPGAILPREGVEVKGRAVGQYEVEGTHHSLQSVAPPMQGIRVRSGKRHEKEVP